jgi:solute carrier family 25 protein 39/40
MPVGTNGNGNGNGNSAVKSLRRTLDVLRTIVREEGARGLYTGLVARVTKVAPSCAIMICTYEATKAYFRAHRARQQNAV